ncbi:hypothetical protein JCGZ_17826 [Jatropha curcas]|uniref:RING-type domain-containing protein n=1 Tax=Jatropha curcas TaxID=180498 RepID=A0A067JV18_JATCU|nr:hypothetical protein JCGZ_17826 [Jatropha curcas]
MINCWFPMALLLVLLFLLLFLRVSSLYRESVRGGQRRRSRRVIRDIESRLWLWEDDDDHEPCTATNGELLAMALEEAYPVIAYDGNKEDDQIKYNEQCVICLEEFKQGEECRVLLPSCNHAFHKACIDTWLLQDDTCPLCRVVLSW